MLALWSLVKTLINNLPYNFISAQLGNLTLNLSVILCDQRVCTVLARTCIHVNGGVEWSHHVITTQREGGTSDNMSQ